MLSENLTNGRLASFQLVTPIVITNRLNSKYSCPAAKLISIIVAKLYGNADENFHDNG